MSWPALLAGEFQISDENESLRRQIHPRWERTDGTIKSEAFKPRNKMASTTRDSALSPEQAHSRYRNPTIGSCVISVLDIDGCGLRAIDDSAIDEVPDAHAYIDLRNCGSSAIDKRAKHLKRIAMANGIWRPSAADRDACAVAG